MSELGLQHVAAASLPLVSEPVPEPQRVEGMPRTGIVELGDFGGLDVGVWEMTEGGMRDVEVDELFVVIAGAASVEFVDEGRRIDLAPGDIVRLHEGQRTVWTVTDALRKVYLAP